MLADAALPHLLRRRLPVLPLPATHAPIASGWSNSCRVGYLPPTGPTPLSTAHDFCGLASQRFVHLLRFVSDRCPTKLFHRPLSAGLSKLRAQLLVGHQSINFFSKIA